MELDIIKEVADSENPDRDSKSTAEGESVEDNNQNSPQMANRRYKLRPRKRSAVEISAASEEYVHNPKRKKSSGTHSALETIFEEPVQNKNGDVVLVGLSKVKRFISFSQFVTKAKLKKRKAKLKKFKTKKSDRKILTENAPLQEVEGKLNMLGI